MIRKEKNRKKVVIGMSGGVDSSVSAYLLKEQGYEVIGVTFNQSRQMSQDFKDAKKVCEKMGITHKVIDIVDDFQKEVIDYFVSEYGKGLTPSPCVICDERIKIKKLIDIANEEGAFYIATGHYCHTEYSETLKTTLLKVPIDLLKDQTYMLYRIKPETLERMLFPLYGIEKNEVREIAKKIGLEVFNKKDSQGICFAQEGYIPFLKSKIGDKIIRGNYVNKDGKIMGEHMGYQLYTVGQRRGLGLKEPRPWFIIEIRPEKNEIVLGEYSDLDRKEVELIETSFNLPMEELLKLNFIAKPRFSSRGLSGHLELRENRVFFVYDKVTPQNAPGQHLVLYYEGYVIGGGKILL